MRVRMKCTKSVERFLDQIDPQTKQDISGVVHDVEMVVATVGGKPGKGAGHPDNKEAFIGSHGASLNLIACAMPFKCGKEYFVEIAEAPAPAPPAEAAPTQG